MRRLRVRILRSLRPLPQSLTCYPCLSHKDLPRPKYQFGKFFNVLKKLHVNILFIDALSQMPMYANFLKEILSKKSNIVEHETIV